MGRHGPNVAWVGLIVRTDDGQVHAVEMDGLGGRVTADLVLNPYDTRNGVFPITAIINGVGKYWREGENLGPDVQPRVNRQIEAQRQHAINNNLIIEGVEDGTRG